MIRSACGWTVAMALTLFGCRTESEAVPVPEAGGAAVYVLGASVFGPDGTTGYVLRSFSLASGESADLGQSIEVPGGVNVYAPEGQGVVFAGSGEKPELLKLAVGADGSFSPAGRLSFAGLGLTSSWFRNQHVQFASGTKAYVLDGKNAQLIVWNPTELTVDRTIPLDDLVREGASLDFSYVVFRRDGQIVAAASWRALDFYDVRPEAALVVIDTATDRVSVDRLEGCGEMTLGAATSGGDLYFSTGVHGASVFRINGPEHAPAPCLARVKAGESTFDRAFTRRLNDLAGGRPTADMVAAGPEVALVRVYDDGASPIPPETNAFKMRGLPGWRWWRVDLRSLSATELKGTSLGAANTLAFPVESRQFVLELAADYSASTLVELHPDRDPSPGLRVTGVVGSLVRAR